MIILQIIVSISLLIYTASGFPQPFLVNAHQDNFIELLLSDGEMLLAKNREMVRSVSELSRKSQELIISPILDHLNDRERAQRQFASKRQQKMNILVKDAQNQLEIPSPLPQASSRYYLYVGLYQKLRDFIATITSQWELANMKTERDFIRFKFVGEKMRNEYMKLNMLSQQINARVAHFVTLDEKLARIRNAHMQHKRSDNPEKLRELELRESILDTVNEISSRGYEMQNIGNYLRNQRSYWEAISSELTHTTEKWDVEREYWKQKEQIKRGYLNEVLHEIRENYVDASS